MTGDGLDLHLRFVGLCEARIAVPTANADFSSEPKVGDVLEIEYDGSIAESYPAQILTAYRVSLV